MGQILLHKSARTTPAVRTEIKDSTTLKNLKLKRYLEYLA